MNLLLLFVKQFYFKQSILFAIYKRNFLILELQWAPTGVSTLFKVNKALPIIKLMGTYLKD